MPAKTLATQWKRFLKMLPPEYAAPEFVDQVKVVFYSGAIAMNELYRDAGQQRDLLASIVTVKAVENEIADYMEAEIRAMEKKPASETPDEVVYKYPIPKSCLN